MWEAAGNFLNGPVRTVCVYDTLGLQGQVHAKRILKVSVNWIPEGDAQWGRGSKKRSRLLAFRLKGCCRELQAEVREPRLALTRRLYGTVAVMSSVMSHAGSSVGEPQLLGIQM